MKFIYLGSSLLMLGVILFPLKIKILFLMGIVISISLNYFENFRKVISRPILIGVKFCLDLTKLKCLCGVSLTIKHVLEDTKLEKTINIGKFIGTENSSSRKLKFGTYTEEQDNGPHIVQRQKFHLQDDSLAGELYAYGESK